jgi:hypothetical protein
MARKCKISSGLLREVEDGWVTHPNIVIRIQRAYKLNDIDAESLLPMNRRMHGGDYEPDRYLMPCDIHELKILPRQEEIEKYIVDHHNTQRRQHAKRSNY